MFTSVQKRFVYQSIFDANFPLGYSWLYVQFVPDIKSTVLKSNFCCHQILHFEQGCAEYLNIKISNLNSQNSSKHYLVV